MSFSLILLFVEDEKQIQNEEKTKAARVEPRKRNKIRKTRTQDPEFLVIQLGTACHQWRVSSFVSLFLYFFLFARPSLSLFSLLPLFTLHSLTSLSDS